MKQGLWAEAPTQVSKVFLITGGSKESRREKADELTEAEAFLMVGDYHSHDETVIIFANNHAVFKNMTFQKAKKLAGNTQLGAKFRTTISAETGIFGIITLPDECSLPVSHYLYKREKQNDDTTSSGFCSTM